MAKKTLMCPKCKKEVTYTTRMWNTKVCDRCNTIISSARGIDKAQD